MFLVSRLSLYSALFSISSLIANFGVCVVQGVQDHRDFALTSGT